ncbi:hypothetical protein EV586_106148 [Tumebacillus sp. BK434]|uniref:hypothetical protein n=1 Tax=Tumebacillus sp. BK434 TaxID=2512169 RepID=UPI00104B6DA4|nr:hypothetical protein [Tumebacillus sp. BK434]TCP53399.1 hypothetical protein EV586_106148 [Tumebacillus sp. BK434]
MAGRLRVASIRSTRPTQRIRQIVTFRFNRIGAGFFVVTRPVRLRNIINNGEVIVSQRSLSAAQAVVRYQFVNATTGVPVSNSVTVRGNRTVVLPFLLPAGTVRLRISNIGAGAVALHGVVIVF